MNIAIFLEQSFDPNAGGVQRSTSKLAMIYKEKGHKVIIISSNKKVSLSSSWKGISIFRININSDKNNLNQITEDYRIKILINQAGYSLSLTKFILKNVNKEIKIINTLRINPLNFYNNHEFLIESYLRKKNLKILNKKIIRKVILGYHIFKQRKELSYIVKNTDAFVMLSERFKSELYFLVPKLKKFEHKIHGIGNPFQRPNLDISSLKKENIILFVGRLNIIQKRVDLLVRIWKKLHEECPDWKFWVVGEGESRDFMENFCKKHKLDRVTFFGQDNPDKYYKKAKVFHMTSAFEGFGNVLVEAQSYACVPFLFNTYAAAQDIIENGTNGILVKPFDINDYVDKTIEIINNSSKLNGMSFNAYEKVIEFSYDETYKKWDNVFKSLIKE